MKAGIAILTMLIGLLWACSNGSETASMASTAPPNGEKIFKIYCVNCHGLYGDMGANGAHDLSKSTLSLEERVLVITKGRNTMTPFEKLLSEEKIRAVAEYTFKLGRE